MGLTYSSVVDASLPDVFSWHTRPGAITRLTPPWQPVRVLRRGVLAPGRPGGARPARRASLDRRPPAGRLRPAARVRRRAGLPAAAVAAPAPVQPGGERATLVTDVVETPLPARALRSMFVYRHRQLAADLAALARSREISPELGTGPLTDRGHRLRRPDRHRADRAADDQRAPGHPAGPPAARHAGERQWRPEDPAPDLLDGVDAVIHLAGASIGGRFTAERKAEIRDSRILPTRRLAELAAGAPGPCEAFVAASAIGIYGPDRDDEVLTEDSPRGEGFLADVVADWEAPPRRPPRRASGRSRSAPASSRRPRGGMLRLLSPLFEAGLGGPLGSGKQWLAWIGLDDLLDVYLRAVLDPGLSGPVNAVAPEPVRNVDYTRTLAAVLHRPACCRSRGSGRGCCSARRGPGKSPRPARRPPGAADRGRARVPSAGAGGRAAPPVRPRVTAQERGRANPGPVWPRIPSRKAGRKGVSGGRARDQAKHCRYRQRRQRDHRRIRSVT